MTDSRRQHRHVVLGGGLAGLHTAWRLQQAGADWLLLEARDRLGGRIDPPVAADGSTLPLDLGPSWFWPHQRRVHALLDELGLEHFDQHEAGDVLYELDPGAPVQRSTGGPTPRSLRPVGGTGALVDALAARLDPARVRTGTRVESLRRDGDGWRVAIIRDEQRDELRGATLFAALPPRLLAALFADGTVSPELGAALATQQTWMSAQAKCVVRYETAFWRQHGLSGDAFSRIGPLAEIHDASDADLAHPALFGFVGVPAGIRRRLDRGQLEEACVQQLVRLFGDAATEPLGVHLADWSLEALTASDADLGEAPAHAHFPMARFADELATLALLPVGSEFAHTEPGYLEGALEASEAGLAAAGLPRA